MRQIILIFFVIIYSINCYAQTENSINKDSSNILLSTFKFKPYDITLNQNLNVPSFNFKSPTRFTLYQNSISNYYILYDSYRNEYKSIQPYHNFGSALLGGAINSIIMLFEKKK